jgi:hypothetical protein
MFGVDKGDQQWALGVGFSCKAHFNKWYKKAFLAILNIMLKNAFFAWYISAPIHQPLNWHDFYTILCQQMLNYKEATDVVT